MITEARSAWLTYEKYYGLREKPFALSSDPRFFYRSQPHASAYEDLLAGIRRRESLSVLSGEIGTGKTTLCRAVLQSLDRQTFSAFVWDPFASREDLLKMVLMEFGVISVDDLTSGRLNGAARTELSYLLYEFLGKLAPLQAFAVLVIDEAQNLSMPLLEEIRILSDSDGRERQLQVILVGQPELGEKLLLPELRQVEQRVSVRCNLEPLTREGVAGYVTYRLQVAEGTPDRISFTEDGIDMLEQSTRGVPRLINRVCDRALHHGHLRRAARIDADIIRQAMSDVGLKPAPVAAVTVESAPKVEAAAIPDVPEVPAERVEVWLATMHEDGRPGAPPSSLDTPPIPDAPPDFDHAIGVPRTHLERLARRWLKRASVAAMYAAGFGLAAFAATFALAAWDQRVADPATPPSQATAPQVSAQPAAPVTQPAAPAAPVTQPAAPAAVVTAPVATSVPAPVVAAPATVSVAPPVAAPVASTGGYVIQIALFSTQRRADTLVDILSGAGFPASRANVRLSGGIRHQIIAGPYRTAELAQADLKRLRAMGGYDDSRVVETSQNLKPVN